MLKKNGKLRPVHDLQPLNAVTIKDASLLPNVEGFMERCGGHVIYTLADIFVGYDHRPLAEESQDLTTFQTPLGPHHLMVLPMGWTNSVPIFQANMEFILQDKVNAQPFIDDVITLGPPTYYTDHNGKPEVLRANPGIRRFIWEHLLDVYRVVHHFEYAGVTISGPKLYITVPEVLVAGVCAILMVVRQISQKSRRFSIGHLVHQLVKSEVSLGRAGQSISLSINLPIWQSRSQS